MEGGGEGRREGERGVVLCGEVVYSIPRLMRSFFH